MGDVLTIVTLTTDFGTQDGFVGAMKGVILSLAPRAIVVDITHEVPPQSVRDAAFALETACPYFPEGTVHVAVVDPGVGGERRALIFRTRRYFLVGPDNGIFSLLLEHDPPIQAVSIENRELMLPGVSATFHGRDVFAPAAAHLVRGIPIGSFGPEVDDWESFSLPEPEMEGDTLRGQVVHVDRFGNLMTNLRTEHLPFPPEEAEVRIGGIAMRIYPSYSFAPCGTPLALFGSSGRLEVAVRDGSAREVLGVGEGEKVVVGRAK